jgi:hypothetical protein
VEELGVVATFCHGHNRTFKGKWTYLHECQAQAIEGDTEFEAATQWSVQAIKSNARQAPAKREDMCCPLQRDPNPNLGLGWVAVDISLKMRRPLGWIFLGFGKKWIETITNSCLRRTARDVLIFFGENSKGLRKSKLPSKIKIFMRQLHQDAVLTREHEEKKSDRLFLNAVFVITLKLKIICSFLVGPQRLFRELWDLV